MPYFETDGRKLYYDEQGEGLETIVLSHGYLMSSDMYAAQIKALSPSFRVIAYDHRGHGKSDPCPNKLDMYDLVRDAEALVEHLGGGRVHFAGMSTGGFVGMRLLLARPDLIQSLILIDTAATDEPASKIREYKLLLFVAKYLGLRPLLGKVTSLMFGPKFRAAPERIAELKQWKRYITDIDLMSALSFGRAIFFRDSVLQQLADLKNPAKTLIIVGDDDTLTPPQEAQAMHEAISGSQLVRIPDAGHSTPIETPQAVTRALQDFLPASP